MSEHAATISWSRNNADFGYKNYSRDHDWKFANGVVVAASATPAYLGSPQRVDPESAFVAALSSCHMLTLLALASYGGYIVDTYEDHAVGHLEKNAQGKLAVTRVDLKPVIKFSSSKVPSAEQLKAMHE